MNKDFFEIELGKTYDELANIKLPDPILLDYYNRLNRREIWINGEIDETVVEWTQQILDWNRYDKENNIEILNRQKIKVFINSNGGCLNSIMHFITILQLSETPVMTIGLGKCYSSGGLLLIGGHKGLRYIFDTTSVLIHDGGTGSASDTGKFIDYAEYVKMTEEKTKEYILSHTKITEEEYDKNYRRDWWILSAEAIRYGIADKIITNLDEII
jgi:ATP-dependent Clp protease protease subunit